ncbi:MAG: DUF4097 family beta strand repeat-containing protein [Treponema sp.]|jgi:DUF4097 and DUF4098 domain-containing protein YvlB|nr:DUF4097 family beta strand repeat-containing protein [Treponema sp.]
MKSIGNWFIFLALVTVGLPVYAADFTVDANFHALDMVVEKSPDGQIHIIKNFDEVFFNYSENITGTIIKLVSDVQLNISGYNDGRITYHNNRNRIVQNDRARVIVQVPDGVSIKFVSTNGGITVNNIDCTSIKFVSTNGGITINNIDCASIDIKTTNGSFTLNKSKYDSIELDMPNGSIHYTGGIEGQTIALQTVNGSIDYTGGIGGQTITLKTVNGSIHYTGEIEAQTIALETANGNINIELKVGNNVDVDVDIQSNYSYRQRPSSSGWDRTGYTTGKITNKKGSGIINAVTQNGNITHKVLP